MSSNRMSVYAAPKWGAKVLREANISQNQDGTYFIDELAVENIRRDSLFSELVCVNGTTHIVLTAFLRLVR
jgi:hypothetical protein